MEKQKDFIVVPKPNSLSWEDIRQVIWLSHADNRVRGIYMRHFKLSAREIQEKVEAEGGQLFVALDGDKLVGTAAVLPRYFRLWCGEGMYAYCCFAAVLPEYRGFGVYRNLCKAREAYARSASFHWMMFDVHQRNQRLLDISRETGYLPVGCQYWDDHYSYLLAKWLVGSPPTPSHANFRFFLSRARAFLHRFQNSSENTVNHGFPIIIGQGYAGRLSLARSLAHLTGKVTLINLVTYKKDGKKLQRNRQVDAYSKVVDRILFCANDNELMLRDLLRKEATAAYNKPILVPDNDFSAYYVDAFQEDLKDHFLFPHICGQPGGVAYWMDKSRQKTLAKSVGLVVPDSVVIDLTGELVQIPQSVRFPCFVKPLASRMGRKWSMRRCDNAVELADSLRFMRLNFGPIQVLVEDFMSIGTEYATVGFSDGTNVVIPGYIEMNVMGHGRHFGVAVQGVVCPPGQLAPLLDQFKALVLQTGFQGLFDIDFYESDGTFYFCELNLRFGGSGFVFTHSGVNLPEMMARSLMGQSLEGMSKTIDHRAIFFNERVAIEDWYEGYLSLKEYRRLRAEADVCFIENTSDPGPGRALRWQFILWFIRRIVKMSFGKKLNWIPSHK